MGIQLSLPNEDWNKSVFTVILCAGEGVRLQELTRNTPKPLIKIPTLKNKPILQYTIDLLISLSVNKIAIVKGYLPKRIDEFIAKFTQDNAELNDILYVVDATKDYKLGPLYSFLSFTKNKQLYHTGFIYLIIPGDTIFDYNLLEEILSKISNNFDLIQQHSFVFYRKIGLKPLKELYNVNRIISNAEITKLGSESILKRISQYKIKKVTPEIVLNQIIPITILNYDLINEILNLNQQKLNRTIWETLNHLIFKGKKIIAFEIESKYDFYDIDYLTDLKQIKKKRDGQ